MFRKIICLIFLALFLVITACTSTTGSTLQPSENHPPAATASYPSKTIFFPRQEKKDGERAVMEALIRGTLVLVDNCIRIDESDSGDSYLLIWPPDFNMTIENGTIEILNGDGEIVAHIGDRVHIGGGGIPSPSVYDKPIQEQVPPQCTKPYWIIGDW